MNTKEQVTTIWDDGVLNRQMINEIVNWQLILYYKFENTNVFLKYYNKLMSIILWSNQLEWWPSVGGREGFYYILYLFTFLFCVSPEDFLHKLTKIKVGKTVKCLKCRLETFKYVDAVNWVPPESFYGILRISI